MFARIALLSVVALALAACAASPTGRSQLLLVSDADVNRMGSQAFQQIKAETELSRDRAKVTMVNCITEAIVTQLQEPHAPQVWEVTVFAEDSVNAFALPGGYIGVFEGLMKVAENQHQLAAVIGHEIAHVTARHGAERISRHQATGFAVNVLGGATGSRETAALLGLGAQVGLLLPFGRAQETDLVVEAHGPDGHTGRTRELARPITHDPPPPYIRLRGSKASRSPSPSRFHANTETKMKRPGRKIHQRSPSAETPANDCAVFNMRPQLVAGGWMPRP